ncbi:MAG: hypothetical protein Q8L69_02335 [Gallionellaceae bacterium]|nr:hypothetical protein [Gallionellaceae bacterium]
MFVQTRHDLAPRLGRQKARGKNGVAGGRTFLLKFGINLCWLSRFTPAFTTVFTTVFATFSAAVFPVIVIVSLRCGDGHTHCQQSDNNGSDEFLIVIRHDFPLIF